MLHLEHGVSSCSSLLDVRFPGHSRAAKKVLQEWFTDRCSPQVFVSIDSLRPCACHRGILRLSSSMHSAFLRSGEKEILTIVQKYLDNRPNSAYTKESSVIPTHIRTLLCTQTVILYVCTFKKGGSRKGHHVISRRRISTLETMEV